MKRIVFDPEDAPSVLTAIALECQRGERDKCPGIFHTEDTGEPVFCVHTCHRVPEAA
jgi:hypothetical protein